MTEALKAVIEAVRRLVRTKCWAMELPSDRPFPTTWPPPWNGHWPPSMPPRLGHEPRGFLPPGPDPTEEARLFARDALKAARECMAAKADMDVGSAMMAAFSVLAVEALFPDLVSDGSENDASNGHLSPVR